MGGSKSCIDLILTDQPKLVVESGVHPSLHEHCHHQIVYGKLSVSNIALPPYTRRIWYYDKTDFVAIMESIELLNWHEHLNKIKCPNEQIKLLNEVLLNIYSNFIPNQLKTILKLLLNYYLASPIALDNASCQKIFKEKEPCL